MTGNKTRAVHVAALLVAMQLGACSRPEANGYQGYVEGEYLYLAAPQAGYLQSLDALRGSRVTTGQQMFAVSADPDNQALVEAEAKAGSARE